jgi:hypothetical protein
MSAPTNKSEENQQKKRQRAGLHTTKIDSEIILKIGIESN